MEQDGLRDIKQQNIQQVAQLLARNFSQHNPLWKSFNLSHEEMVSFMRQEVILHLKSQQVIRQKLNNNAILNVIYVLDGKIIAAGLNLQLHQYLRISKQGLGPQLKQFELVQNQGKRLFQSLKIQKYENLKHLYGSWLVIDQSVSAEVKKSFRNEAMLYTYKQLIDVGFKSIILRASNIKSAKIYGGMGGVVLSQGGLSVNEQDIKLWLYELQFDCPIFKKILES